MYHNQYNDLNVIKLYLEDFTKKLYLREISRLSRIPLRNIQITLSRLEEDSIIKPEFKGKNKYFYLNLDNIRVKYLILKAEIHKTIAFLNKYSQFSAFLKEINDIEACIIIFGSFAQFSADRDSDLDLLIISNEKIDLPNYLIPNKIHEIKLNKKDFIDAVERDETFIKKIKENHVILNNHSFFINTIWRKYAK